MHSLRRLALLLVTLMCLASPKLADAGTYEWYLASCQGPTIQCWNSGTATTGGAWGAGLSYDTVGDNYLFANDTYNGNSSQNNGNGSTLGLAPNASGDVCQVGASPGPINAVGGAGNPNNLGALTGWSAPNPSAEQATNIYTLNMNGGRATTCGAYGGTWEQVINGNDPTSNCPNAGCFQGYPNPASSCYASCGVNHTVILPHGVFASTGLFPWSSQFSSPTYTLSEQVNRGSFSQNGSPDAVGGHAFLCTDLYDIRSNQHILECYEPWSEVSNGCADCVSANDAGEYGVDAWGQMTSADPWITLTGASEAFGGSGPVAGSFGFSQTASQLQSVITAANSWLQSQNNSQRFSTNPSDYLIYNISQGTECWRFAFCADSESGLNAVTSYSAAIPNQLTIAGQGTDTSLWVVTSAGATSLHLGMASGTSPAITQIGNGYELAEQVNTNALWTESSGGVTSAWNVGMATHTNPAIATVLGGYETAVQTNGNDLWTVGTHDTTDQHLAMAPGSSPAIADQPNAYVVAFRDSAGKLEVTGPKGTTEYQVGVAANTSPAITETSAGSWAVAYQSTAGTLCVLTPDGSVTTYTGSTMAAGTSPAITPVANGLEMAYQSSAGTLTSIGPAGTSSWNDGMWPGTSPTITPISGGYQMAIEINTGDTWTVGSAGTIDYHFTLSSGTSPGLSSNARHGEHVHEARGEIVARRIKTNRARQLAPVRRSIRKVQRKRIVAHRTSLHLRPRVSRRPVDQLRLLGIHEGK